MTDFGIIPLSVAPVRKDASDASEMISQLLLGEYFSILSESSNRKWLNIRSAIDNYEGWIDKKQASLLNESKYKEVFEAKKLFINQPAALVMLNGFSLQAPMGSVLPENVSFFQYQTKGRYMQPQPPAPDYQITKNAALSLLNSPYLWGGRTFFGIDCSGFIQLIYKLGGLNLPRDSKDQSFCGNEVNHFHDVLPGDLIFLSHSGGPNINHVGMLIEENKIIHASGRVRIDKLNERGIFNNEEKKITHSLIKIKRIFSE